MGGEGVIRDNRGMVLPATGRLGTSWAAEFPLQEGIPRSTATTGPAPWQLPIWAQVCTRTNFNTGPNLHTGALHTGALL